MFRGPCWLNWSSKCSERLEHVSKTFCFFSFLGEKISGSRRSGCIQVTSVHLGGSSGAGRPSRDTHTSQEAVPARRPSQTLCVLGNHRVWYSQCREGPCGRNRRAGACLLAGARYSSSSSSSSSSSHSLSPLHRRLQCVCLDLPGPNRSL